MEFSIIEAIFGEYVHVAVIEEMLRISKQYPTPMTFTGDSYSLRRFEAGRFEINLHFVKKVGISEKRYSATFSCQRSFLYVFAEDGTQIFQINIDMAKFLYYKIAMLMRGIDIVMNDDRGLVLKQDNKAKDNVIPDRLMKVILDTMTESTSLINAEYYPYVELFKAVDPGKDGFTFIESYDKIKKMNVYYYTPAKIYTQTIYNSSVGKYPENCTHVIVAREIANRWRDYLRSIAIEK